MKVSELAERLQMTVINSGTTIDSEITGGYASDLLSDVMGNVESGMVWITLQTHRNIVAVASLREVAAIVLTSNATLDNECLDEARREQITVLHSPLPAFESAGEIYRLLHL